MGWALTVAAATFLLSVIWGAPLIEIMRRLKLGKNIRIEGRPPMPSRWARRPWEAF